MSLPIFRRMLSYLGFSAVASAVALVTSYITALLMAPRELGEVGVLLSIFFLIGPAVSLSSETLVLLKKTELPAPAYVTFRRRFLGIVCLMTLLITTALGIAYQAHFLSLGWYAALPLLAALRALSSLTSMEFVIESKSRTYGLFIIGSATINLVITYSCLIAFGATAPVRLIALITAEALTVLLRYRGNYRYLIPSMPTAGELSEILKFGMPLVISVLPAWLFNEADKFYLARKMGLVVAGGYVAACTLASVIQLFNQALVNSLTPRIYYALTNAKDAKGADAARAEVLRSIQIATGVLFLLGTFTSLAAVLIGPHLLPQRFVAALPLVPYALFALVFNGVYRVIAIPIEYFRLTTLKTALIFVSGAAAFCIYQVGFPILGTIAAPAGVITGYGLLAAMLYWVVVFRTRGLLFIRNSNYE